MKLRLVRIHGFRSVKEKVKLFIDPKVTILIGANDHGKTTLLEAVRRLNADKPLTKEDENWDSLGQGKPILQFEFKLDSEELGQLASMAEDVAFKEAEKNPKPAPVSVPNTSEVTVEAAEPNGLPLPMAFDLPLLHIPETVTFKKAGVGGSLELVNNDFFAKVPGAADYLLKNVPRVELFEAVPQLMDVVTLPELNASSQEFMQGIFRYAGIWEGHENLFR
jgi:hypothetical protein